MKEEFKISQLCPLVGQTLYEANQLTGQENIIGRIDDVAIIVDTSYNIISLNVNRGSGNDSFRMLADECRLLINNGCYMRMLNNCPMLYFIKKNNETEDSDNQ